MTCHHATAPPPLIDGRPKWPLGAAPWIAKPVCDCCGSRDRAELVGDRILCTACAEED